MLWFKKLSNSNPNYSSMWQLQKNISHPSLVIYFFYNHTHKTKIGTTNSWETTNSNTHKTKIGTANSWETTTVIATPIKLKLGLQIVGETTNSKPPGPIICNWPIKKKEHHYIRFITLGLNLLKWLATPRKQLFRTYFLSINLCVVGVGWENIWVRIISKEGRPRYLSMKIVQYI